MTEYERKVRDILLKNGCYFIRRGKGKHDVWFSPIVNKSLPVDTKIKSRHTANAIIKQAGINHKFSLYIILMYSYPKLSFGCIQTKQPTRSILSGCLLIILSIVFYISLVSKY